MLQTILGLWKNRIVLSVLAILVLGGGLWGGSRYMGWDLAGGWLGAGAAATADPNADGATAAGDSPSATVSEPNGVNSPAGSVATRPSSFPVSTDERPLLIGTFNVRTFGKAKFENAKVVSQLHELMLPFDIIAVQEVRSQDMTVIKDFVLALNQKFNVRFNYITSPWLGDDTYKEQYAYIFDTQRVELLEQPFVMADTGNKMQREPLVARFQAKPQSKQVGFSFVLVNVHTQPEEKDAIAEMNQVSEYVTQLQQQFQGSEDDILVLGDFNLSPAKVKKETGFSTRPDWDSILGETVMTNTAKNQAYDNILYRPDSTEEYQGRSGVIDLMQKFKITSEQAKDISDHMPVWAVFSTVEAAPATAVATAATTTTR